MTTDTPRTCPHCGAFLLTHHTPAYCEERTARKKAEAEVERLKGQLQQAVDIAEWYMDNLIDSPRKVALDEIKLTLNPDNK
jgi:predicted  nucleic acid-binding Zn-ribbon protein